MKELKYTDKFNLCKKTHAYHLNTELWNDIAENGYSNKVESIFSQKYMPSSNCFLCHYLDYECQDCLFNKYNITDDERLPCNQPGSSFRKWGESTSENERKKYAIEIAQMTIDALNRKG